MVYKTRDYVVVTLAESEYAMTDHDLGEFDHLFCRDQVIGESLLPIMGKENAYCSWVNAEPYFRNQIVEATLGLVVETLVLAGRTFQSTPDLARLVLFKGTLAWFTAHFRRFRAAEIIYYSGYGICASSLLRDVRDWAFQVSALQASIMSWNDLHGGPLRISSAPSQEGEEQRHKQVIRAQRRANEWALGENSGLSQWRELRQWYRFSNYETHGSLITTAVEFGAWLDGSGVLPLGPTQDPHLQQLYISRSLEIGHIFLRLLPILQVNIGFGEEWAAKWRCLDKLYSEEWAPENVTRNYMLAFGELIRSKFAYDPDNTRFAFRVNPDNTLPAL